MFMDRIKERIYNSLFVKLYKTKKVSNINEPNKRHDFIYIDDVCNAIINTIKHSKKSNIIEIGSGKVSSIKKIAKLIKKISNNKLRYNLNLSSIKNNVFKAKFKKQKRKSMETKNKFRKWTKKILRLIKLIKFLIKTQNLKIIINKS